MSLNKTKKPHLIDLHLLMSLYECDWSGFLAQNWQRSILREWHRTDKGQYLENGIELTKVNT